MKFLGRKKVQDLENRAAHPHQECVCLISFFNVKYGLQRKHNYTSITSALSLLKELNLLLPIRKKVQDLENQAAHPQQEFPGVPPHPFGDFGDSIPGLHVLV